MQLGRPEYVDATKGFVPQKDKLDFKMKWLNDEFMNTL